jgi:hypothetical protein
VGSETEGSVLDIPVFNKTNVDICRISLVDFNLGYERLHEHHTYGDRPESTTSATSG